jgi:hypothetical protein
MARWDRNFYTAQVGGPEVVEDMHRRGILRSGDTIPYALGLSHGSYRGLATVGHGGSDAGYRSQFLRFPGEEVSVAVLCNFPSSGPGNLARRVADVVLEEAFPEALPEEDPEPDEEESGPDPVPLSDADLEALAGFYLRAGSDIPTSISAREGHLFAGRQRLLHQGDWVFHPGGGGDGILTFRQAADGTVHSVGPDGAEYTRHPRVDGDELELEEYVGHYWSEELGVEYQVRLENGRLYFANRKVGRRTLLPTFRDGFAGGNSVTFFRNESGQVAGFTQSSGRVWKVRFRRLEGPYPSPMGSSIRARSASAAINPNDAH